MSSSDPENRAVFAHETRRATWLVAYLGGAVLALFPGALKLMKVFTVTEGRPGFVNVATVVFPDFAFALASALALGFLVFALARARGGSLVIWVLTTLYMIVTVGLSALEHQTWVKTASLLDWGILTYTVRHYAELRVVIASETTAAGVALLVVAGLLALLPVSVDVVLGRRVRARAPQRKHFAFALFAMIGFVLGGSAKPSRPELMPISKSAAVTLLGEAIAGEGRGFAVASDRVTPSPDKAKERIAAQLARAGLSLDSTKVGPKNVLLFILESTRFDATTLYVPHLPTTPVMERLALHGAVVDRVYVDMPHTSKAITAVLCGYAPRWSVEINEAEIGGLPGACAPHVFDELGYKTAFFQSAWGTFENRRQFADNAGFQSFTARESLRETKFSEVNYLAVEDKAMVEPILRFVDNSHGNRFFATVMTCGSHHSYGLPNTFRTERFARYRKPGGGTPQPADEYERYLNTVHYVDDFIGEVVRGLAQRGVLDDTLIVVVGDHGQGFLEHGEKHHNDVIHEEGLHVPLLFYSTKLFPEPKRVEGLRKQTDILPTILSAVGARYPASLFEGSDLLASPAHERVFSNCWYDDRCAAEYEGTVKVIDFFGTRPSEVYDLAADPFELHDLAASGSAEQRKAWEDRAVAAHQHIVAERQRIEQRYLSHEAIDRSFILDHEPEPSHRVPAHLGSYIELLGYDASSHEVTPGGSWEAVVYFRCLKPSEDGWRLFGRLETVDNRVQQLDYNPANGRFDLKDCRPGMLIADHVRMWVPEDFPPGALDFYWGSDLLPEKGFIRRGNQRLDTRNVIALERGVVVRDQGVRLAQLTVLPKYRDDLAAVLRAAVFDKEPALTEHRGVRLGDGIVLEEARVEPAIVRAFGVVKVTTTWRVDRAVLGPWQIFTDLVVDGHEEGRMHAPVDGLHPVMNWKPGTWVRDTYTISVPGWIKDTSADVWLGFGYERKHMPITERGSAETDSRKRIKVATIKVTH